MLKSKGVNGLDWLTNVAFLVLVWKNVFFGLIYSADPSSEQLLLLRACFVEVDSQCGTGVTAISDCNKQPQPLHHA